MYKSKVNDSWSCVHFGCKDKWINKVKCFFWPAELIKRRTPQGSRPHLSLWCSFEVLNHHSITCASDWDHYFKSSGLVHHMTTLITHKVHCTRLNYKPRTRPPSLKCCRWLIPHHNLSQRNVSSFSTSLAPSGPPSPSPSGPGRTPRWRTWRDRREPRAALYPHLNEVN